MSVGERIREARDSRGMTRAQLGEHLDTHPITIYRWERGDTRRTPRQINGIARALGVRAEWIRTGTGPMVDHGQTVENSMNAIILSQNRAEHAGKTIAAIDADTFGEDLVMAQKVVIRFTDGTSINLTVDWRGDDAYISQREGA